MYYAKLKRRANDEPIKLDFKLYRKKPQLLRKIKTDIKKFSS
ncbi:hypothetical protein [Campylobacter sp.]|nr:hypothetical protein [Campylobacter sp.]MDY4803370.1 hypothetical protein [Campylobacter sp.]